MKLTSSSVSWCEESFLYAALPDSESELLAELEEPELELESLLLLVPLPLLLLLSLNLDGRGSLPTTSTTGCSDRWDSGKAVRKW